MKVFNSRVAIAISSFFLLICTYNISAQTKLVGYYTDTGYFFNSTIPCTLNQLKTITKVDSNTFQVSFGNWQPSAFYSFRFKIDSNHNLVNWEPLNYTPTLPNSGFMTLDNPGNFTFPYSPIPGQSPYLQSIYNNTYDPITNTFFLHYGCQNNGMGINGQYGFNVQVYEKLQIVPIIPAPIITSFSPNNGKAATIDTIRGRNLSYVTSITFGDTAAKSFTVLNDSVVLAVLGTGASGSVKVTTLTGTDSLNGFTYVAQTPTITSFSPVTCTKGDMVYIFGSGFLGTTNVSFGGTRSASFDVMSDTKMYSYVGTGSSGSVSVTTLGGTASFPGFTYVSQPLITSFSPTSASPGTTVTILGSGFSKVYSVFFGNSFMPNFTIVNDSTITTIVTDATTSGSITVYTNMGNSSLAGFNYYPFPVITDVGVNPIIGDSILYVRSGLYDNVIVKTPISSGQNLVWDYTYLNDTTRLTGRKIFPSTGKIHSDSTNINFSQNLPNGNAITYDSYNSEYFINLDNITDSSWNYVGAFESYSSSGNYTYKDSLLKPMPKLVYPTTYGTHFTDSTTSQESSNKGIYNTANIYDTVNCDAYGTLKLPNVTYNNVLLVKHILKRVNSHNYFEPLEVEYLFMVNGIHFPLMKLFEWYPNSWAADYFVRTFTTTLATGIADIYTVNRNNIIEVNWQTETELNTANFIIQHSIDGSSFTDIGAVNAVGSGANSYHFSDNNPFKGINYYRLQIVNKDGSVTFSKTISVIFMSYELPITVYPNPARNILTVKGNHINAVQVIDNMGKVVKIVSLKEATNPILSLENLTKGIYHIRVQTSNDKVRTTGFIKE